MEVLEYIALRERNALFFLKTYIEKVLRDSEIYADFEAFFRTQTKDAYQHVKEVFSSFIIRNTKINGTVECNRIFIKVLNPLAYFNNSCVFLCSGIFRNSAQGIFQNFQRSF